MKQIDLSKCDKFLDEFSGHDLIAKFLEAGIYGKQLVLSLEKRKFVWPDAIQQYAFDTPWVHTKMDQDRNCTLYHHIIFPAFNFIPKACINCWKIVVRPRTVYELFQLYNLQVKMDVNCKCGVERGRPFVSALYGGYFYTNSQEEGQERYEQVRKAVDEQISPEVSVILKRYCSEFEQKFGPSDKYERPADADNWEELIDKWVDVGGEDYGEQTEILVIHVMRNWLLFANQHQDPTAKLFNDTEYFRQPVTYHKLIGEGKTNGKK